MPQLKVKRLFSEAFLPTVAYAGEDLGFDLYAYEDTWLPRDVHTTVRTGVALEMEGFGFRVADRGSMAKGNITTSGGVMDAGFRGEWMPRLTYHGPEAGYQIKRGERVAQAIPQPVYTGEPILEVDMLSPGKRGLNRFGSSGR